MLVQGAVALDLIKFLSSFLLSPCSYTYFCLTVWQYGHRDGYNLQKSDQSASVSGDSGIFRQAFERRCDDCAGCSGEWYLFESTTELPWMSACDI